MSNAFFKNINDWEDSVGKLTRIVSPLYYERADILKTLDNNKS
jgi:hypothetical protein